MANLREVLTRIVTCIFLSSIAVLAQVQPGQLATQASPSIASEPLSIGEKYQLALQRTFDPVEIFRMSLSAGLDQERNYPSEWGQGWDAFGVRMASHFGQHLIREQLEAGVWAIDHEDPRHRRSGLTGVGPRTRYAIVHTFVTRSDSGTTMPAYSRFVGDYGAGFISREWYPDRFHTVGQGLEAGTISLGVDVGMNILREFWPHRWTKAEPR